MVFHLLTNSLAGSRMRLDPRLNGTLAHQDNALTNWATQPGQQKNILKKHVRHLEILFSSVAMLVGDILLFCF